MIHAIASFIIWFALCLSILALAWITVMIWRNNQVYKYRTDLIDKIYSFPDWGWRAKVFRSVSYDEMMVNPFRSLSTYYPDKSFIGPAKETPDGKK